MSQTVVFPEAVPPETPASIVHIQKSKSRCKLKFKRERNRPMTKGCLGRESEPRVESGAGEEVFGEEEEEGRRPSSRRPEKWGPDAASIT